MSRLENKTAIITGAARGIGAATAMRFSEEGARVVVWDLLDDAGEKLVAKINSQGGNASYRRVNVTQESEVQAAVEAVIEETGKVDILVNNAAITGANKMAHEVSVEEWDQVFAVNVKGTFLCTKHCVRHMLDKKQGSIVNFSSIYGLIGNDDVPPYHATKGAILSMTKTDAMCYAPQGIRVNTVHPGSTKTELFKQCADSYPEGPQAYYDMMGKLHPLCLGEPVDVANAVLFLASDEACFITGASLAVDGGYTAQ